MRLQTLRRLAAVAGRETAAVDLAENVLGNRQIVLDLDVLEHRVGKTELLGQEVHDLEVVLRFEDRLDDLLAPLDRPVGRGARAVGFVAGGDRQQISAVLALRRQRRPGCRMRIANHEQVELFDALLRFGHARHGVAAVTHDEHRLDVVLLPHVLLVVERRVEPAGRRDARRVHRIGDFAVRAGRLVEAVDEPVVVDFPDARPMPPCAFDQAVVKRQGHDIESEIGRTLHVGVAAEDVGAGAGRADIAGRQTQDAERAHVGGTDRVLGRAHAPDQRRGLLRREHLGDALELRARHAGDALDFLGRPLGDFLADVVHAVDALFDELLVFPAVLEDVMQHPVDHRNVGAGTNADIFSGMRRRARHARIDHDEVGALRFLAFQDVLKRNRMRFGGIAAHKQDRLGVADVRIGVCHRAVAPGVGNTGNGRRMADTNFRLR